MSFTVFFSPVSDISRWPLSWPRVSALIIFTGSHVSFQRTHVLPNTVDAVPECSFYWRHSVEYRSSLTPMFRVSTFVIAFFLYQCFHLSWLVPTNRYETTWPVSRPSPLLHSQLSESLYFRNLCWLNFTFVLLCFVTNFFIIKTTRCANVRNLFWHETLHVSDSSSVHHQEFIHCTLSNGICHTNLSRDLYDIYHCWVCSEWTPYDGQRNCPKHVEFHAKINLWN